VKRLLLTFIGALSCALAQENIPLATIEADHALWPREVTVNVAHLAPIVVNGKPAGSMQAPAGRIYPLKSVGPKGVTVDVFGSELTFPEAETDLAARAAQIKAQQAALAAAKPVPVAATPAPVPAAASPSPSPAGNNPYARLLSGDLVTLAGRNFHSYDAAQLSGKKYLAIYFSASWCPPCRQFTPDLVSWYGNMKAFRDKFEVILVCRDASKDDMRAYMQKDNMEWPAAKFDGIKRSPLNKFAGPGIPCLVVVDEKGTVVFDSYEGKTYVGPQKVMRDFTGLLKGS